MSSQLLDFTGSPIAETGIEEPTFSAVTSDDVMVFSFVGSCASARDDMGRPPKNAVSNVHSNVLRI